MQLTIADFAIIATATTVDYIFPVNQQKWPKLNEWMTGMKALPFFEEINQKGLDELKMILEVFLKARTN